jgi:exodeoxyribonuclease-5
MLIDELKHIFRGKFHHPLTADQDCALQHLADFLFAKGDKEAFVLRGFAGTGKTSLVGALVQTLHQIHQPTVLMAPTGRAAKVFSIYAATEAYTIHKRIYRSKSFAGVDTSFDASFNPCSHTLFIVDEASMIGNDGLDGSMFGTGRLLDDLIQFVYNGRKCRLLLVGDTAQLPPVGEEESPALSTNVLQGYGLNVHQATLTQVVRQGDQSGVLWNATRLRKIILSPTPDALPRIKLSGFADIRQLPGNELVDALQDAYTHAGKDDTIVITRSNKRAILYNRGIRSQILGYEEEVSSGDRLMIAKNNYYWTERAQHDVADVEEQHSAHFDFIANGDTAVVRRMRHYRDRYGFRFADAVLTFPDYGDYELNAVVLLDSLQSEAPALTAEQNNQFFSAIEQDYVDVPRKADRMKQLKENVYFNALQAKYAYAITCHKAQGGQWNQVFLDQGYMTDEMISPEYFRWLYTAFTRSTGTLYLVNWPEKQIEN